MAKYDVPVINPVFPVIPGMLTDDGDSRVVDQLTDTGSNESARVEQRQQDGGLEEFFVARFDAGLLATADNFDDVYSGADAILARMGVGSGFHFGELVTTLFGDDIHFVLNGFLGDDTLTGGNNTDLIHGGAGNDVLSGLGGDDGIDGGAGNDLINGNNGNDVITGGTGLDTIFGDDGNDVIAGNEDDDSIEGGNGDDQIDGGSGDDVIRGNDGNDIIVGSSGDDFIEGNDGDDRIDGGSGEDLIQGNDGNDLLTGGTENDTINGGLGDDIIDGGADDDDLYGGGGEDIFYFATDTTTESVGDDFILDFISTGRGEDQIDLTCVTGLARVIVETVDQPDPSVDQTQEQVILSLENAMGDDLGTIQVFTVQGADSFQNQPGAFGTGTGSTVRVEAGVDVVFESLPITQGLFSVI